MEYKVDDKELRTDTFLSFVDKIWPGNYDTEKTEAALTKTINITAYDGQTLVGCLRILSDVYFGAQPGVEEFYEKNGCKRSLQSYVINLDG